MTFSAAAQTFVTPQEGGLYRIKGSHSTNPWLTATVESGGIDVATNVADAAIYEVVMVNGKLNLKVYGQDLYIGTKNNQITLVSNANETALLGSDGNRTLIMNGGRYLYNNQPDYTREAGNLNATGNEEHPKWGFVEYFATPETGKFYKIKGTHSTKPWLTANATLGGNVVVSEKEADAAVFLKTASGIQAVSTGKYLGYTGRKYTYSDTELGIELRNTGDYLANYNNKYAVVSGGNYMFNNSDDGIVHESTQSLDLPRLWAFIEVEAPAAVAQIGETNYYTLAAAVGAAKPGDEIVMLADAHLTATLTLPAGIKFNGNGKTITADADADGNLFNIVANGNIEFVGYTKVAAFNAGYNKPTITIGAGACLEMTGARMVIGHGATFNITGNITEAKTANVADLTPSLVMAGASFTGAGVTFNVTNAYIKAPSSYCSSSKSASGTFDFNITNSIWESAGKLAFEEQSVNAKVDFALVNSVLTTGSHLVFGTASGEEGVVIDNSYVNKDTSRQLENCGTMTIKNGSVVNGAVATSSNAKNPGTIIVENATYAVTGEFSGSDLGTGTLIIKDGATVSAGSITKANIQIYATNMVAGDDVNLTANLSKFTGTLSVINNDKLEAKIENGKIVLAAKPVAKIGEQGYATLDEAVKAAQVGDKITLLDDADLAFAHNPQYNNVYASEIDLNGKTMTMKKGDVRFDNVTIKNGNIIVQPGTYSGTAIFLMYSKNLTLNGVKVTATGVASTYLIDLEGTSNLNLLNGSEILVDNATAIDTDIICANNGATKNKVVIDNSKVTVNNIDGRVFFSGNYTVKNSEISLAGISKAGFRINAGQTLSIEGTSKVNIEGALRDGGIHLTDLTATYTKAATATVNATVNEPAKGSITVAYTNETSIWGEGGGNAKESLVIKVLDANDNVMGTSTLNNVGGIIDGDVYVTWSIMFNAPAPNPEAYWSMEWTTAPSVDNMPAKVAIWVDGVEVSRNNVVLNGPDDLNKIVAAVTDAEGKIISCHTSVANAAAVNGVTNIALLRETNEEIILSGVELNKNGFTAAGVTVKMVAKVGNTEYSSIDKAIAAWTNGTTLTLLDNVTLSDVIKLNSTEHHILNLGTYTMTAKSGKDAIEILPKGVGTAAKACLTINADTENPGGITATGKSCIYYYNSEKINDRMMVTINGGVFEGSYAVNSLTGPKNNWGNVTSPLRGQGAAYYVFNGGTFNAQVYINAGMLKVTGGTFNKNLTCMGDITAYRLITGGKFSGMTMTADAEGKFTIGSAKSQYDVGVYVDDKGYLVVGGAVVTEPGDKFEASANYGGASSYLQYSSAKNNGLYYTSVKEAFADNNKTTGVVTVYADEIDMTGITYKGTIIVPAGESVKINNAPVGLKVATTDGNIIVNNNGTYESKVAVAQIGETKYTSLAEALAAATEGATVTLLSNTEESIAAINNVKLATAVAGGVTVKNTYSDWINMTNVAIGTGVTLEMKNVYYTNAGVNVIEGTLNATTLYNANNSKTTVQNGGKIATTGMIVNRYHTAADAGIYVYGDGDASTVEVKCDDTIGTYSGTFYAKDAVVNGNMLWIDYLKGSTQEGDNYSQSKPVFENSTVNITKELRLYKDATLTLVGANVTAGTVQVRENATPIVNVDANSTIKATTVQNLAGATLDAVLGENGIVSFKAIVAKVGNNKYYTLEDAFKAATSGCTIEILSDVTVDYNWDARKTGAKFLVPVTINGNGKTIKFTASVNDNNYQAPFRFEADATVKNLIVDMSEVTDNRFRAISSKGNLTVDGCKFIGKDESLNCRAIIFGEGAGANVGNLAISITNSEFINWKRGITDNENAQDVKTVTITGNTLTDAGVGVSAKETVTFTGNTVAGAYVNIKSYTDGNKLAVTATGNTLEANTDAAYNVINAGGAVKADEGFNVVAKGGKIIGYTSTEGIYGEVWGNSRESFVIKVVDAQGNVMGTTSLNNVGGIIDGDVYVTWNIKFNAAANTDEYWTMAWTTAPSIDNMPAKVQLWVDGVKVSEGNVVLNGPDNLWPIAVAVTDENGVIKSCAQSLKDAIAAGNNVAILKAGTYALEVKDGLTITGAVEGVEFANIGAFGCNGANVIFNNVTFTYAENSTYKGLQHSGNLVYNNCTFNGQVFLYGQSETFNNCTFNTTDAANYNVWTYGAKEVAFNECTFNSAGKSVLIYSDQPSVTNNVTVTKSKFIASQAVDGKAAIEMDSSISGAISLTIDGETTVDGFAAGNVSGNSLWNNKKGNATDANNDITVKVGDVTVLAPVYEAQIGEKNYRNLQDAINAVQNGETVVLVKDFTGNITLTEKVDLYYTIDGDGKTMNGTIAITPLSDGNDNRRITIKNIKFVNTADAKVDFISCVVTNHYPRLTVEGCTFTGNGKDVDVALRLKTAYGAVIKECTGKGLHSFLQNTAGLNLTIENVTVTDSKSAFALGTVQGVTVKGVNVDVKGYGIRLDAQYNNNAVLENNTVKAFIPVVVRKAEVNSNVTFNGDKNAYTATNNDGIWCAVGTSEYEANGELPTAATAQVKVDLTDTGLNAAGVYGSYYDALTIHVGAAQNSRMVTRDIFVATMDEAVAEAKAINTGAVIYKVYGEVELTTGGSHGILDLGENVVIEGADATAKLTIVGGGVPDIKGVTFRNITLADEGTYLPTANEFMYQNYIDCTFENVTFVDGIRLSGTSSIKDSKVDANTTNEYAIWLDEGEFTMTGTTVVGGADAYGLVKSDKVSKITITGNTFQFLGEANKEALNVKEAVVIAENNKFIDCVKGILPADKTNYTDESKTTVATDATIIAGNNTVTVNYAAIDEQKFETLLEAINAVQEGQTITLLRNVTMDYNARDAYATQAQNVVINGNGNTLTLNQKNSDWASFGLANNSKLVLNNMTIEKTGYGDTSGAWNTHAIIFSCPVEMTDVTVNNAVAVAADATLNNVAINEANGYYGLWIEANGQTVNVNGGSITATNGGRGIKIADQYIDNAKKVVLNVDGTAFSTAKKAAVLVSSTAGAQIAAANVNIANVAEDKVNFVWVDEDWAANYGNVEVTGATVAQEGIESFVAAVTAGEAVKSYHSTLRAAVEAAQNGETITLLQDIKESVTISKNLTIDGAGKTITGMITTDGKSLRVTIKNVNFDGNDREHFYAVKSADAYLLTIESCIAKNYMYGFLYANSSNYNIAVKNVSVENCRDYGAYTLSVSGSATFENFTVKGSSYGVLVANKGTRNVNFKNVTFECAETPIYINENGTGKVTFTFEGVNEMSKDEFYTSQYVNVVAAAQVGTKVCGNLNDAFSAAQTGDTVKMLGDLSLTAEDAVKTTDGKERDVLFVVNGKEITLDMNGKKISVNHQSTTNAERLWAVIYVEDGAGLTVTGNGSIDVDANDNTPKVVYTFLKNGSTGYLVIENGNFHMDNTEDSMVFSANSNTVTVKGGTFILDAVASKPNGWPVFFGVNGTNVGYVNVVGGTYNYDIRHANEIKFGEGLTTTKIADNRWTVVPAVATVGEKSYGSIQEAIDAAQTGETVKLIVDVTLTDADVIKNSDDRTVFATVVDKDITLDLNGKTINVDYDGTTTVYAVFDVANGASLNVTGNGKIDIPENGISFAYIFLKRGTEGALVIENGQFHMDNSADCMAFSTNSNTITVKGGTFILDAVASKPNGWPVLFGVNGNNTGYVNVVGGTFNYDINHQERPFEVFVPENLAVKANGNGTWTIVPAQAYVTELLGAYVNEPGSREHKVGYATVAEAIAATNDLGKTVTILAGDYTGNLNVNKGVTVKGEVDENGNNLVTFNGKLNITADGATVKNINVNNGGNSAAYVGAKDVVVDGCQIVGGNGFRSCYTSGTVTFKNSTITGATYGIHFDGNAGGNIVIENCTITGWTSFASTIENVTISGTTFAEGNHNKLRLYQNATITECTFNEKMSIDFGKNGTTAAFNNCSVENGKALTDVIYIADIAEMGIVVTINGVRVCVAAKVDNKYYLSLQAAIDAATEGQTVTIVSDIALTEGVTVAADDEIFIDLNGKTVSMETAEAAVAALIKNNGTLTIESSVDGGKLSFLATAPSAANAYASNTISNYGTLTINAGTVENLSTGGACYALDNYAGSTANICGGKLTAEKTAVRIFNWTNGEANAAELNVVDGEIFSNDGYGININAGNAPYVALNISGGTITTNDTDYNLAVYVVNKNSAENFTANISGGTFNGNLALNGVTSTTMAKGNVSVSGGTFDGVICYGEPACQFIAGGSYKAEFTEDYLVYGYQLEANTDTGLYDANWTGRREEVTFIDGEFTEYTNEKDIEVGTLTYKRTISAAWQAFYVPFQVPVDVLAAQGFEVAYINGVRRSDYNEDGVFDDSGFSMELIMIHGGKGNANGSGKTLKANYPYFIRPVGTESKELTIVLNDALLYAAEDVTYDCSTFAEKFEITGNSSQVVVNSTDDEFRYVVTSKGEWSKRTNPVNVKPFRFYMTVTSRDGSSPLVAESSMSIVVRGEELPDGTTVIYDVYDENTEDMIFDLQGRRVLETEKGGIYIKGGKKFIAQ